MNLQKYLTPASAIKRNAFLVSLIYLALIAVLTGLKTENLIIAGGFNLLIWLSDSTRKFVLGFSIFILFGVLYDLMKVYPNYRLNPVDIQNIYLLEKSWFGIHCNGSILTPNEYFAIHHNSFFDILAGISYINWIPVPLAFGGWLYFNNKRQFLHFSLSFLFVNLIGFTIWYAHPAAPPWYVAKYGFQFLLGTGGDTAGLGRFDQLIGLHIFEGLYARNSNVFAAMPSLHCAYPLIVFYYGFKANVNTLFKCLFGLLTLGIWGTAIYSGHHYVLDAIAGILCTIIGLVIFQRVLLRWRPFNQFLLSYEKMIK